MAAHPGSYSSGQLVLIDGGGNDAADLVGAYLGAASGAAGASAYQAFLTQQLSATTLASLFSSSGGAERAAGAYMAALADTFYASVKAQVLDRGATNVAILNVPDITLTPRFRAVLGGVSAQAGAATATALQAGIREWIKVFNDRLRTLATGEPRVVIVDFNGTFTQQVNAPAAFGLTNTTDTACPVTGVDSTGLPAYNFLTCTDSALDGTAGRSAGWWKTYTFSDGFHPTPAGHQLLADTVVSSLRAAGWL
jgi:phospholipase/lecithinase/hemolysin